MILRKTDLTRMPETCAVCDYFEESIALRGGLVSSHFLFCGLTHSAIFSTDHLTLSKDRRSVDCPLLER